MYRNEGLKVESKVFKVGKIERRREELERLEGREESIQGCED